MTAKSCAMSSQILTDNRMFKLSKVNSCQTDLTFGYASASVGPIYQFALVTAYSKHAKTVQYKVITTIFN